MGGERAARSDSSTAGRPRWICSGAIWTAVAAGGFSLVVCAVLTAVWVQTTMDDPLDSPDLRSLQAALRSDPGSEPVKQQIRRLDLQLRHEYFRRQRLMNVGSYMLAVGLGVFLIAAKLAANLRTKLPSPGGQVEDQERRTGRLGRWATGGVVGAAIAAALIAAIHAPTPVEPAAPAPPEPVYAGPTPEQIAANWARFRGPGGAGVSKYENIPMRWDGPTGEGVVWKAPVPLPGQNSPVVWDGRILLTGADELEREVYCFDAGSGRLLWTHPVENIPRSPATAPDVDGETGFAAPTGVTDGRRFFAIFANGDLVCVDLDGKRLWARNLGLPDSIYGYSSSLTMHGGNLLVLYDQGGTKEGKSFLYAIDPASGRTVWKAPRPVGASWASPIVIRFAGRDQLITLAEPRVISHDPATGRILWWVSGMGGDVAPSPIFAGGLVFAVSPNYTLLAIRPDGGGDVTATHVAWEIEENVPDICSPVSDGELLFTLTTGGLLSCFETARGTKLWEHEFDQEFRSSPSLVGERLYALNAEGVMYFVGRGRTFKLLGRAALGEPSASSPAFADGRIYIRGSDNLYCIDGKAR